MIRWFPLLLFVLSSPPLQAQELRVDSLYAPALGREKAVIVLLPAGYDPSRTYPLLLLLHGLYGDHRNWTELTGLTRYAAGLPLIIVMPDGENSWYVDQHERPRERFEGYMLGDLLRYIRRTYSIDTTRMAVGGLSMGGYGALVLALRHPDRFSFVAALSASLDIPQGIPELEKNGRGEMRPSLVTAFGAVPSVYWNDHNVFILASQLRKPAVPYLYLASGIQDEFAGRLPLYRAFADTLRAHNVPYEYHEKPGRHNWEYWDREIRVVLRRLKDHWHLQP